MPHHTLPSRIPYMSSAAMSHHVNHSVSRKMCIFFSLSKSGIKLYPIYSSEPKGGRESCKRYASIHKSFPLSSKMTKKKTSLLRRLQRTHRPFQGDNTFRLAILLRWVMMLLETSFAFFVGLFPASRCHLHRSNVDQHPRSAGNEWTPVFVCGMGGTQLFGPFPGPSRWPVLDPVRSNLSPLWDGFFTLRVRSRFIVTRLSISWRDGSETGLWGKIAVCHRRESV